MQDAAGPEGVDVAAAVPEVVELLQVIIVADRRVGRLRLMVEAQSPSRLSARVVLGRMLGPACNKNKTRQCALVRLITHIT